MIHRRAHEMVQKERYIPDELDIRIMSRLQNDSNISVRQLAKSLNIPTSTTQRRVANLYEKGIIKGCSADLDKEYLGYSTVFTLVKVTPKSVAISRRGLRSWKYSAARRRRASSSAALPGVLIKQHTVLAQLRVHSPCRDQ